MSKKIVPLEKIRTRGIETPGIQLDLVRDEIELCKKNEPEILDNQKIQSLGVLAGGIAHDFNNFLTAIIGNIEYAREDIERQDTREVLDDALDACNQAKDLAQQLLTFAKGGVPIKKVTSLAKLLENSVSLALRGSNSRCRLKIARDLWHPEIDRGQIGQVINNLLINAKQAMPDGGEITVIAENITVTPEFGLPLKNGQYVRVSIADRGKGIAKKEISQIFDPYFTTKCGGSGLGLASAYSIINKHEGYIGVESRLHQGSEFYFYLPACDHKREFFRTRRRRALRRRGKILIMDDEPGICRVNKRLLERIGYQVDTTREGGEAIELFRREKSLGLSYDIVILDLTVPGGMGGKETLEELQAIDPMVIAIVCSGYSSDPVMANFKDYGFRGVMVKPYAIEELSEMLYNLLPDL